MAAHHEREPPGRASWAGWVTLALGLAATGLALACERVAPGAFTAYLGPIPPAWGLAVCTLGASLGSRRVVLERGAHRAVERWLGGASLSLWVCGFCASITLLDRVAPLPDDINLPWPQAFLFYPAIAFVAETVFHVVPLALLAPVHRRLRGRWARWALLALVALIEPVFQAALAPPGRPAWAEAWTFVHIFAINGLLVSAVAHRGIPSGYAVRVGYYAYWHVLYGQLRLG